MPEVDLLAEALKSPHAHLLLKNREGEPDDFRVRHLWDNPPVPAEEIASGEPAGRRPGRTSKSRNKALLETHFVPPEGVRSWTS